ncbi:MAG: hypothetical protein V1495_00600 [Pseudomonadota bacterium]
MKLALAFAALLLLPGMVRAETKATQRSWFGNRFKTEMAKNACVQSREITHLEREGVLLWNERLDLTIDQKGTTLSLCSPVGASEWEYALHFANAEVTSTFSSDGRDSTTTVDCLKNLQSGRSCHTYSGTVLETVKDIKEYYTENPDDASVDRTNSANCAEELVTGFQAELKKVWGHAVETRE